MCSRWCYKNDDQVSTICQGIPFLYSIQYIMQLNYNTLKLCLSCIIIYHHLMPGYFSIFIYVISPKYTSYYCTWTFLLLEHPVLYICYVTMLCFLCHSVLGWKLVSFALIVSGRLSSQYMMSLSTCRKLMFSIICKFSFKI